MQPYPNSYSRGYERDTTADTFNPHKENTEEAICRWFEDPIRNNSIRFQFRKNDWSAEYRVPLDNSGKSSDWRFLCCGSYAVDHSNVVKRIINILTDKLRSTAQDFNGVLSDNIKKTNEIRKNVELHNTFSEDYINQTLNNNNTMETSTLSLIKKIALKVTNPDESVLREAGFHDECGTLTNAGKDVLVHILREKFHAELVELAKAVVTENNKK